MPHTLEGGTDAAEMVLFDPAALPEQFDAKVRDEPVELLEQLAKDGRVCWINTEGDGSYTLGVFVDEALPAEMREFAKRVEAAHVLHVPGGRLVFAGVEYTYHEDDSFLRKYPHMGSSTDVPAGVYGFELFEIEYPDGFHKRVLRERLPASQYRTYAMAAAAIPAGCLAAVGVVLSAFALGPRRWAMTVLPAALVLWGLSALAARTRGARTGRAMYQAILKEFPDYAAVLRAGERGGASTG